MNPAVAGGCDRVEHIEHDVEIAVCARHASVCDGGGGDCIVGWIVDRNLLAAVRVVVGIATVDGCHYEV